MWAALQTEYGDRIEFVTVDATTAEGREFSRAHGIRSHPGFVVFDASGEVVHAALGPWDEEGLRALVRSVLPE